MDGLGLGSSCGLSFGLSHGSARQIWAARFRSSGTGERGGDSPERRTPAARRGQRGCARSSRRLPGCAGGTRGRGAARGARRCAQGAPSRHVAPGRGLPSSARCGSGVLRWRRRGMVRVRGRDAARTRGVAFKHARRGRATGRRDFWRRVRTSRPGDVTLASALGPARQGQ